MDTILSRGPAARTALALFAGTALLIGSFVWQGHYGFNIGDEGFLWYGVQRVQAGELPIRDFMSYDPGRYYWSVALMGLLHDDGIIALRIAVASFQLLGLFIALLLLSSDKSKLDITLCALAAITLLAWMYPRHKLFDISLSIILIGILTLLVQQPSRGRFFFAGVGVGLVAAFGRNHGVYGAFGIAGVVVYLGCRRRNPARLLQEIALCACGCVTGYLPILVTAAAVPGFAVAFWDSITVLFHRGTNLPLPVPWPWLVPVTQLSASTAASDLLTGAFFIAIVAFGIASMAWIIQRALRRKAVAPEFVACAVLALPYAHFAFSRADVGHLAQGIFPFLIGAFIVLRNWPSRMRRLLAVTLTGASLFVMLPQHPGWACRVAVPCVVADIAGSAVTVDSYTSNILSMLESTANEYAPDGANLVVAPIWPGAYPVLKRRSPMWEIYALFPQGDEFQRREIERIKAARPRLVLILDVALDEREDLRFRNTHPLVDLFFRENFDPITIANWAPDVFQFYKSR